VLSPGQAYNPVGGVPDGLQILEGIEQAHNASDSDDIEIIRHDIKEKLETSIGDIVLDSNLHSSTRRPVSSDQTAMRNSLGGTGNQTQSLTVPQTELRQFENPCRQFINDYDNVLEDHGVSLADVRQLATSYDQVRQLRRQHPKMGQVNSDLKMAKYFEKNF
jgi:hypothetical protein